MGEWRIRHGTGRILNSGVWTQALLQYCATLCSRPEVWRRIRTDEVRRRMNAHRTLASWQPLSPLTVWVHDLKEPPQANAETTAVGYRAGMHLLLARRSDRFPGWKFKIGGWLRRPSEPRGSSRAWLKPRPPRLLTAPESGRTGTCPHTLNGGAFTAFDRS